MRDLLEEELTETGFRVLTAGDGNEAIQQLSRGRVDLIVTDLQMPGMKGRELLDLVRVREPNLPVIIITAFGSIDGAVDAMRAGAYYFLSKPFSMEQLLTVLEEALQEQSLKEEIESLGAAPAGSSTLHGREVPGDEEGDRSRCAGGAGRYPGPAGRRNRDGQGAVRQDPPLRESVAQRSICRGELLGDPGEPAREPALRVPPGSVHRRPRRSPRALPGGGEGHAAARRDRRHAAVASGQAPASLAGEGGAPLGGGGTDSDRRESGGRHASGSDQTGAGRSVSPGSLLSAECHRHQHTLLEGTSRGSHVADRLVPEESRSETAPARLHASPRRRSTRCGATPGPETFANSRTSSSAPSFWVADRSSESPTYRRAFAGSGSPSTPGTTCDRWRSSSASTFSGRSEPSAETRPPRPGCSELTARPCIGS